MLPPVHLRDNLRLDANEYRIRLRGVEIARGTSYADRFMVLEPSGGRPSLSGADAILAKEPAFGLEALWITAADRARAEAGGMTVVDPASVMTTHLSEVIRRNIHELVGRQEIQELLAALGKEAPKLVEDVVPGTVTLGELVRVVRGVLREGLSVRDLRTILEAIADGAARSKDTAFLVEQVRRRLFRQITAKVVDGAGVVKAITLDRMTEDLLRRGLGQADGEAVAGARDRHRPPPGGSAGDPRRPLRRRGKPHRHHRPPRPAAPAVRFRQSLRSGPVGGDRARAGPRHPGRSRRHHRFATRTPRSSRVIQGARPSPRAPSDVAGRRPSRRPPRGFLSRFGARLPLPTTVETARVTGGREAPQEDRA